MVVGCRTYVTSCSCNSGNLQTFYRIQRILKYSMKRQLDLWKKGRQCIAFSIFVLKKEERCHLGTNYSVNCTFYYNDATPFYIFRLVLVLHHT